MRWTPLFWIIIAATTLFGCANNADRKTVYWVAPDGRDGNPGTKGQPFATIQRAREAVRERIIAGLDQDIVVSIRAGTYWLPDGIVFGPGDSGTPRHSITYAACSGEQVNLIGGQQIGDWRDYQGAIKVAPIPKGTHPAQLFENGRRMILARRPQTGYFKVEAPAGDTQSAFRYKKKDFDPTGLDLSSATVFLWAGYNWFSSETPISSLDPNGQIITTPGTFKDYEAIKPGNRYFIRNVLAFLKHPGECQMDRVKGSIYAWPSTGPVDQRTMVISTAPAVLAITGQQDRPVRNVHFLGLDVDISNGDAVAISNAQDCSVKFCRITNAAQSGISINGYAQRITVYGNLIKEHGYHGVQIGGLPPGQPDVNNHNTVENNHIHHCGRLVGHGRGVEIVQSGHNRVTHNHIHHMPRYGVSINGLRLGVLKEQFKNVTLETQYQYTHSNGNLVAFNDLHHVNLDSDDTGVIESWGSGRDNVIDHNLIHDSGDGTMPMMNGIYLDDGANFFTVTNNIIYDIIGNNYNLPIYAKGIGHVIDNNIIVMNAMNDAAIVSVAMYGERCDNHVYTHNIIYNEGGKGTIYGIGDFSEDRVKISDYNVFWNPEGLITILARPLPVEVETLDDWRRLPGKHYDAHSIVADPMFMDPANHNYRLKKGSPALSVGFRDIETSAIGLTEDFPPRFERN